ncbi:hypothetical protein J6590_012219 [Homalodisca vitripennis]|nr:hypothetical protein J6590_012219 [Homalodisca vitripennis]
MGLLKPYLNMAASRAGPDARILYNFGSIRDLIPEAIKLRKMAFTLIEHLSRSRQRSALLSRVAFPSDRSEAYSHHSSLHGIPIIISPLLAPSRVSVNFVPLSCTRQLFTFNRQIYHSMRDRNGYSRASQRSCVTQLLSRSRAIDTPYNEISVYRVQSVGSSQTRFLSSGGESPERVDHETDILLETTRSERSSNVIPYFLED